MLQILGAQKAVWKIATKDLRHNVGKKINFYSGKTSS